MRKVQKGQYGYISYQRWVTVLRTIGLFAIAFAILIFGICQTGTKSNAFTIIAILGMLPASKSAVNMIMFLRYHNSNREQYEQILKEANGLPMNFDLIITMSDRSYQINQIAYCQGTICGFREGDEKESGKIEAHIKGMLNKNNLKHIEVKIWNEYDAFENRITQLQNKYDTDQDSQSDAVFSLLQAISL